MLWGLTGILIPVIIHLLSRREHNLIMVGSLRLFEETSVNKARNITPTNIILLALRCMVIALLVMAMARPVFNFQNSKSSVAVFIDPLLQGHPFVQSELLGDTEHTFWFQNGFTSVTNAPDTNSIVHYWELAHELSGFPADSLVILSSSRLNGLGAVKPAIQENINWIVLDENLDDPINGGFFTRYKEGEYSHYQVSTDKTHRYYTETSQSNGADSVKSLYIRIVAADSLLTSANTLKNYLLSLGTYAGLNIEISINEPAAPLFRTIWLSNGSEVKDGDILLTNDTSFELFSQGDGGTYLLHRIPAPSDYKNEKFAREWMNILQIEPGIINNTQDVRIVSANQLIPESVKSLKANSSLKYSASYIFFLVSLLLLSIERIYANTLKL